MISTPSRTNTYAIYFAQYYWYVLKLGPSLFVGYVSVQQQPATTRPYKISYSTAYVISKGYFHILSTSSCY